jgi:hypothetical protein
MVGFGLLWDVAHGNKMPAHHRFPSDSMSTKSSDMVAYLICRGIGVKLTQRRRRGLRLRQQLPLPAAADRGRR